MEKVLWAVCEDGTQSRECWGNLIWSKVSVT